MNRHTLFALTALLGLSGPSPAQAPDAPLIFRQQLRQRGVTVGGLLPAGNASSYGRRGRKQSCLRGLSSVGSIASSTSSTAVMGKRARFRERGRRKALLSI